MLGSGMNLVTTVIGFGMSATFIVFVCARLICGRIRSNVSQAAPFDIEMHSDLDPQEHTISGLEPVVVAAIPTMKYNKEAFHSREDAQCSICLGEYQEKEMLRIMPICCHTFHLACIDEWLQKQSTCPICRLPLDDTFGFKHDDSPAIGILPQMRRPVAHGDHSNQMVQLGNQHLRGNDDSEDIHESLSVAVESH